MDNDPDYVEEKARIDYSLYGRDNVTGEVKAEPQLPTDIKCGIVAALKEKCLQGNLLEIWRSVLGITGCLLCHVRSVD